MIQLFENEFVELHFDATNSMMREDWKPTSDYMSEEEFMDYQQTKLTKTEEFRPQIMLVDSEDFLMTVAPNLQEWVDENISQAQAKLGLQRVAFIRSSDLFSQISLEQMMSEQQSEALDVDYFDTLQTAEDWLNQELITV